LVETQIWIIPVVFLAIVSTIFGLFAAVLPIRKWLEVNADELDVTAVHNTHEEL
jgi:hypothetical protein